MKKQTAPRAFFWTTALIDGDPIVRVYLPTDGDSEYLLAQVSLVQAYHAAHRKYGNGSWYLRELRNDTIRLDPHASALLGLGQPASTNYRAWIINAEDVGYENGDPNHYRASRIARAANDYFIRNRYKRVQKA